MSYFKTYSIVILSGSAVGEAIALKETTLVGRGTSADVMLSGRLVSKEHCTIRIGEGGARLVDHGSANGTFLNGSHVLEAPIYNGDIILAGEAFLFRSPDERPDDPDEPKDTEACFRLALVRVAEDPVSDWDWKTRPAAAGPDERLFTVCLMDVLELGAVLSKPTPSDLLREILCAKVRVLLSATRCHFVAIREPVADKEPTDSLDIPLAARESCFQAFPSPFEWLHESGSKLALLAPFTFESDERLAIHLERPAARGRYTSFERSLLLALAGAFDSIDPQADSDRANRGTQHWSLPDS